MLSPVLTLSDIARALDMSVYRTRDFLARFEIPCLEAESVLLVDAGICERAARRALGQAKGEAIHRARGGPPAIDEPVGSPVPPAATAAASVVLEFENVEEMLCEALEANGGVLSMPLYRAWAESTGRKPLDKDTICRALDVSTWAQALAYCGGRRGVTTPDDRLEARHLLALAIEEHGGHLRMDDFRRWARPRGARWTDPARVFQAAGFSSWKLAVSVISSENSSGTRAESRTTGDTT